MNVDAIPRIDVSGLFGIDADALIAPLSLPGAKPFKPFLFGDHLWEVTTKFAEQRGIAHLRAPRG